MAEIVNLRQARKLRKRSEREAQAQVNRRAFGRTKHEREIDEKKREAERLRHEGHRLAPDDPKL